MGSGARLRSANQAFGRSRSDAFLITLAPPEVGFPCQYPAVAQDPSNLWNPGGYAANGIDCLCSVYPTNQPDSQEWRFVMSFKWMGWESPPHPAFRIVGNTSGGVIDVPVHCAVLDCEPAGPIRWGRYAINFGITGADWGVVYPLNYLLGYYNLNGPGSPFSDGEDCTIEVDYTPGVLPDPGPYSIVSARPHPDIPGDQVTIFTLDRALTYYTTSAIYIQNTGLYDGMHPGFQTGSPSGANYAPEDLAVDVPFVGTVTGSFQRVFEQTWDCHYNQANPQSPHPPLPPPP